MPGYFPNRGDLAGPVDRVLTTEGPDLQGAGHPEGLTALEEERLGGVVVGGTNDSGIDLLLQERDAGNGTFIVEADVGRVVTGGRVEGEDVSAHRRQERVVVIGIRSVAASRQSYTVLDIGNAAQMPAISSNVAGASGTRSVL